MEKNGKMWICVYCSGDSSWSKSEVSQGFPPTAAPPRFTSPNPPKLVIPLTFTTKCAMTLITNTMPKHTKPIHTPTERTKLLQSVVEKPTKPKALLVRAQIVRGQTAVFYDTIREIESSPFSILSSEAKNQIRNWLEDVAADAFDKGIEEGEARVAERHENL